MATVKKFTGPPAIGIDFGTTFSCVGIWQNDRVEILTNDQGNRTTPSYVAFKDTERLIGDAAKNQVASNPLNTIFNTKRLIGRKFDDLLYRRTLSSGSLMWKQGLTKYHNLWFISKIK